MIFVTVGTELPFDRLVRIVDDWARARQRTDVFAQIGRTDWRPSFIKCSEFLEPPEFARCFASARAVIAHAGMGTILSALRHEKPILVMPRRAALGEHRNEHQLATVQRLREFGSINVALDEVELRRQLDDIDHLSVHGHTGAYASEPLLAALSDIVHRNGAGITPANAAPAQNAAGIRPLR